MQTHMTSLIISVMGLGAFLVFFIQPILGKAVLPYLGGSSSIWATTLAFFTVALCVGYVYAHILSRYSIAKQVRIHIVLLALACASIALNALFATPLYMPLAWFTNPLTPVLSMGLVLTLSVGLPYVLLASTAPLLQNWYTHLTGKQPYPLYSISNAGSLLGLLAYPFFFEPNFSLVAHTWIWCGLFVVYAVLTYCITSHLRTTHHAHTLQHDTHTTVSTSMFLSWVGLAAVPSALLVASTTYITQVIAPVPLLWIIPLTLYLVSFIIAFAGVTLGPTVVALCGYAVWHVLQVLLYGASSVEASIIDILIALFLVSTVVHQYLYIRRPAAHLSSLYYVATSLGGAVGSVCVSIVAPLILVDFFEMHITLLIVCVMLVWIFSTQFLATSVPRIEHRALLALVCLFVLSYAHSTSDAQKNVAGVRERNFYGVTRVVTGDEMRTLHHGNTMHGEQFLDDERALTPTSYYAPHSGIGRSIALQRRLVRDRGLNIGIVGLGTGTMAAYCRPQDTFTYYEIDERMVRIAHNDFSFIEHCDGLSIKMGDGRIALASEMTQETSGEHSTPQSDTPASARYDILAIDAFSDDSVPTHLITKEAVELYMQRVTDTGILAIHTSNRYIDLSSIVVKIANELDIPVTVVNDEGEEAGASATVWILLSRATFIVESETLGGYTKDIANTVPLWTDSYTNIFPVLFTPMSWENVYGLLYGHNN